MDTYVLIITNVIVLAFFFLILKKRSSNETPDITQVMARCKMYLEKISKSVQENNDQNLKAIMKQYREMNQPIEKNFETANKTFDHDVDAPPSALIN